MRIEHQPRTDSGRFSALDNSHELGHLDYLRHGSVLDAHHTFVDPSGRRRGVAEVLLNALIDYATEQHCHIRPSCRYVAAKLSRSHPQLLAKN